MTQPTATLADRAYVGRRVKLELLDAGDVRRIHEATIEVLATTGCTYHSQRALDVLEEHGATVDRESTVAKLPAELVERALATVPSSLVLGGRTSEWDLQLDGEHVYLSSDGCGVFRREADGKVRPSRKRDLEETARVVQALDDVSATSAVVSAQDCAPETRVLHEFDACVRNSSKHTIVVSIKEDWEARSLIRMAEALAGGRPSRPSSARCRRCIRSASAWTSPWCSPRPASPSASTPCRSSARRRQSP